MKTAAIETIQEVAKISQAGLIYAIEKHKVSIVVKHVYSSNDEKMEHI